MRASVLDAAIDRALAEMARRERRAMDRFVREILAEQSAAPPMDAPPSCPHCRRAMVESYDKSKWVCCNCHFRRPK